MSVLRLLAFSVAFIFIAVACGGDDASVQADDPGSATDGDRGSAAGGDAAGTRPSIGGDWILSSATVEGVDLALPADVVIDLSIEGGRIDGNGGCNGFGGLIDAGDDGSVAVSDLAITEMACQPLAILDFETAYVQALARADSWEVTPNSLILRGEGTELVYEAGAPPAHLPLESTVWMFDTVFDGEGIDRTASTPPLDRPAVTLTIEGGQATLSSEDCGRIAFPINHETGIDGNIALPEPGAVAADCDPESNLQTALSGIASSTGFMINESRLTFIGLPGETVGFVAQN